MGIERAALMSARPIGLSVDGMVNEAFFWGNVFVATETLIQRPTF